MIIKSWFVFAQDGANLYYVKVQEENNKYIKFLENYSFDKHSQPIFGFLGI